MTKERQIELRAALDSAADEATLVEAMDRVLHAERTGGAELNRDPLTPAALAEWMASTKRTFPVTKDGNCVERLPEGVSRPLYVKLGRGVWTATGGCTSPAGRSS